MRHIFTMESLTWLRDQRRRAINMLLGLIVVVAPLGLLPGLLSLFGGQGLTFPFLGYVVAYSVALVLFTFRRIDDTWRAVGLLLLAYAFAAFALYAGWLAGSGRVFLLSFIVMAALLLDTKAGFAAAALGFLTFVAYGVAFNQGWIALRELPDPTSVSPIIIEGAAFALVTGIIVMIPWFFDRAVTAASRARQEAEDARALLSKQADELKAANRELEAFSYSVSHDLRAPLRAIDGFSRILLEDYAAEIPLEAQSYLDRVRHNARSMSQLIDDLLAFSRTSRQQLRKESLAPGVLVQHVLKELRDERTDWPVEFLIGDLPPCRADPILLKQVFANLLSNALKFTRGREEVRIEIGCQEMDGELIYFVRDNGVGFDMAYADKLFGVFQRLHGAQEYEGTGVGLAIVQRIIHRHGGCIWAEAELDKGATFFFTL